MESGSEPITATLLNLHKLWLHSKYLSLYTQISILLSPYQGNISLHQTEPMIENYNQSKCTEWGVERCPVSIDRSSTHKAQGLLQKSRQNDCKIKRTWKFSVESVSKKCQKGYKSIKFDQHGCLNKIWTLMTVMDMSRWKKKSYNHL